MAGSSKPSEIDARMAEITGKPQRVEILSFDDLSEDQLGMINRLRAGAGTGPATAENIPEFFLVAVKHPPLFKHQVEGGAMFYNGTIPKRERELAVLRIAWLCRAPYEWGEHVDIGKRNGLTGEEIERATQGSAAPGWSEHDAAVLRGVEELLDDTMITDETWATLAKNWSEQQLMEFPMLVGAYVSTAMQQNSLRLRLAPDNPGLTHR